ncbi:MAG: Holliday junction resolvase RuvX, partial [Actinobacteria bacterium]|nr:Holliday junction resolvase RuvX [Actinomycetota bacterium]
MQRGRRIAFDYGDVRIGVALCDPDAILSSPLTTLKTSDKHLELHIVEILREYEPIAIYVGRPSNMDGSLGVSAEKAADFAELLKTLSDAPVEAIDERLSTISAARSLRESGINSKDAKSKID